MLDTLSNVMKAYLPMGHSLKINNLGVFSLSLQFSDNKADTNTQETTQAEPKTKYRHVEIKGINFKADKKLVKEMNKENSFEHTSSNPVPSSSYTPQERLQRALQHIDKNRFITLQEYANLNDLSRSSASRELVAFVNDPSSGMATAKCREKLTELLTFLQADVMEQQTGIVLNLEAWTEGRMILTEEQIASLKAQAEAFLKFIG